MFVAHPPPAGVVVSIEAAIPYRCNAGIAVFGVRRRAGFALTLGPGGSAFVNVCSPFELEVSTKLEFLVQVCHKLMFSAHLLVAWRGSV